jgi:DNA-directed RNA polymerase subunit RPC12/RpoP
MSIRRFARIDLEDIKFVVLSCKTCGADLRLPLKEISARTINECPSCKSIWLPVSWTSGRDYPTKSAARLLLVMAKLDGENKADFADAGCRILFEFEEIVAQP